MTPGTTLTPAGLLARLSGLLRAGPRVLVGLAGPPGSGKSTLAESLAARLGEDCVVVPMDGFHLADAELRRLGRGDRKGAPDTFDVAGFVAALRRLRDEADGTVYLPRFDRDAEHSVAGEIAVRPEHRLVLVEGNYLLLDQPSWADVRPLLNATFYVEADERHRVDRLVLRHVQHGRDPAAAAAWVAGSDQANAALVAGTRAAADGGVTID